MRRLVREALGLSLMLALLVSSIALSGLVHVARGRAFQRRLCEDLERLSSRAERLGVNATVRYPGGREVKLPLERDCQSIGDELWSILERLGWWIVGRGLGGD